MAARYASFDPSIDMAPGPPTVAAALAYLAALRLPLTFEAARQYLSRVGQTTRLLALYCHYFPCEWATPGAATATLNGTGTILSGGGAEGLRTGLVNVTGYSGRANELYTFREIEFLRLVDRQLFPLYVDYYLDADEREDTLYIPNFGPDTWSYEWDTLHGGWQILLALLGSLEIIGFNDVEEDHQAAFGEIMAGLKGDRADWPRLIARCQSGPPPLLALPLAFEMLEHDTGNIFLDPTDETPVDDLDWTVETLDYLREQWKQAEAMLEKVSQLLDWLTASPANLQEVVNLWNECLVTVPTPAPLPVRLSQGERPAQD